MGQAAHLKKDILPVSPKAFVCGLKKDYTNSEYAKHKEAHPLLLPDLQPDHQQNWDSENEEGNSSFFIFRTVALCQSFTAWQCLLEEFVCVPAQGGGCVPGRSMKGSNVMGMNPFLTLPEMLCNTILDCKIKASSF